MVVFNNHSFLITALSGLCFMNKKYCVHFIAIFFISSKENGGSFVCDSITTPSAVTGTTAAWRGKGEVGSRGRDCRAGLLHSMVIQNIIIKFSSQVSRPFGL